MNIKKWLKKSIKQLIHLDNPKYEAELLLGYVSKKNRSEIITSSNIKLKEIEFKHLNNLVYRRSQGEPMAYLIGKKEFWSLSLVVSYDTLIPRPDTEILVEQALSKNNKNFISVLDLGTGCGAISLALASVHPNWNIIGIDKSKKAIQIAKLNSLKLNIKNVSFIYSNWFSRINKKFHMIVSNPPYVSQKEIKFLKKEIFFEPFEAIFSDKNGFLDIEYIIKTSYQYLYNKGWLLIEHGWRQKKIVQQLFKKNNFFEIKSYKDYGGNTRVTVGKKDNK